MRMLRERALLSAPVLAAGLLAGALILLAVVTVRTMRERDAAVRDGILARAGHELEARLRENGPDGAAEVLGAFVRERPAVLAGAAVSAPARVFATFGVTRAVPFEMPGMLGPDWRGLAGAGRGEGPAGGRGGMRSPFVLRLYPAEDLGRETLLARALLAGSVIAGAGLLGFSLFAARGLSERRRVERLEAERQRLDAVALAGAGLAHRVRNPLAAIKGTAQLMADEPAAPVGARAARIVEASDRIDGMVAQLLRFARPPDPVPAPFDLAALTREVAADAGSLSVEGAASLPVVGDAGHAREILEELIANARALDASGEVRLAVRRDGERGLAEVLDRGPGLSVDPEKAFDPYVTTRPGGTGLGLSIVRALARAAGGNVTLAARDGGGCVARLALPSAKG